MLRVFLGICDINEVLCAIDDGVLFFNLKFILIVVEIK